MPYAAASRDELPADEHERDAREHQRPVHLRHVDLALGRRRGVDDRDARKEAELHRLLRQRERARDERLRRDDGRDRREDDHRVEERRRHQRVEGTLDRELAGRGAETRRARTARQQQRALPEVVEEQRREDDAVPGEADRPRAEMAHVGVERLAAGDAEDDRAEDEEAVRSRASRRNARRWRGSSAREHRGLAQRSTGTATAAIVTNQTSVTGPKTAPTCAVPRRCTRKSAVRIDDRERHDQRLERGRRELEPFDRAEHRDRRRDHAVAVEQRRAEEPDGDQRSSADSRPAATARAARGCRPRRGCRRA